MGECDPSQIARFLSETRMLEVDTIKDTVVRLQEPEVMDEQHLLNSALTRKNPELFMESAHSLKACAWRLHREHTSLWGRPG